MLTPARGLTERVVGGEVQAAGAEDHVEPARCGGPAKGKGQTLVKSWSNPWSNPGQTPGQILVKPLVKSWSNPYQTLGKPSQALVKP